MQLTRSVDLVFPRSGQVVSVQVPVDVFDQVMQVSKSLLSFVSFRCACIPSELLDRLHP
ncbi:MAG: hypothetical protein ABFD64_11860 [Armatimonadota bacterium]